VGHSPKGDDVADRYFRRVDQHAIDQQLDQLTPPRERRGGEAVGDSRSEGFHLGGEHGDLGLLLHTPHKLLLVSRKVRQSPVQRPYTGLQLLERDRPGGIGVDESLPLAIERGTALA